MKPITLYGHHAGPNPKKVIMVLEELEIPYEIKLLEFPEMKQPAYESINPNGRFLRFTTQTRKSSYGSPEQSSNIWSQSTTQREKSASNLTAPSSTKQSNGSISKHRARAHISARQCGSKFTTRSRFSLLLIDTSTKFAACRGS